MNLRFDGDSLRFRVSRQELDDLLAGGRLAAATPLPAGAFRYAVTVVDGADAPWRLAQDGDGLQLALPRAALLAHRAQLPSKEGLAATIGVAGTRLDVRFEVDVKRARGV